MKKIILVLTILSLFLITGCKPKSYTVSKVVLGNTSSMTVSKNENLDKLEDPENINYIFDGWYYDASYTNKVDLKAKIDKDITIYAKMDVCYVVKLHVNDDVKTVKVRIGDKLNESENPTGEFDGKQFAGWYYDETFTKKFNQSVEVEDDIDLYAKFGNITYTVTFETFGATSIRPVTVIKGNKIEQPKAQISKLHYEFSCWCTDEEGKNIFNFDTPITSDLTLYASFTEVSYDNVLNDLVPDEITEDLELPRDNGSINYYWDVSDSTLLGYDGKYNPARTDKTVTVTLQIYANNPNEYVEYSKDVIIKKYTLSPIEKGKAVIGYTTNYNYKSYTVEELKTVKVLCVSFGYINPNGTLNISSVIPMLTSMVGTAHSAGINVLLSLQGYGEATQNFSDCANDPVLRKKLAVSMAETVEQYHLDGIDIDWEYPGSASREVREDRENYTLLMKDIRNQLDLLDGSHYMLTAAIPAGPSGYGYFEMAKLNEYFDYYNMMSYDLQNSSTGSHHSALYQSEKIGATLDNVSIDKTLELWIKEGVPAEKICLGMAFYGKSVTLSTTTDNGLGKQKDNTLAGNAYKTANFTSLMDTNLKNIGSTTLYCFDFTACAPYLFRPSSKRFTTYDNELSLLYKCEFAKKHGLGGVMIWELGEDQTKYLISAVAQGLDIDLGRPTILFGEKNAKVGDSLKFSTLYEINFSALKDNIKFELSDNSLGSINGDTISFNSKGELTITVKNSKDNTVYQSMKFIIE